MDRPESWRKIVADIRKSTADSVASKVAARIERGDNSGSAMMEAIQCLRDDDMFLNEIADRVKAACEALEVARDSADAFTYSMLGAKEDAAGKMRTALENIRRFVSAWIAAGVIDKSMAKSILVNCDAALGKTDPKKGGAA